MIFSRPVPFAEAAEAQAVKTILPTALGSAEMRALGGDLLRRATFSARVSEAQLLDTLAGLTQDALAGELDRATARLQLGKMAELLQHPLDDGRLDLMLQTNLETAQGYGQALQANDPAVLDAFPAWELYRLEDRDEPRDWEDRWQIAARNSGDGHAARMLADHGRMVALKDSPIWQELGNFWDDSLGNPYPPFAFRSGMWTRDVSYEDAVALGLITPGQKVEPAPLPNFNASLELTGPTRDAELRAALVRSLGDVVTLDGDLLRVNNTGGLTDANDPTPKPDRRPAAESGDQPGGVRPEERGIRRALQSAVAVRGPATEEFARVAEAQLRAVERGVKPLFHEQFADPAEADRLASALRPVVAPHVEVATRDGHVYVFDARAVQAITNADPDFYGGGSFVDRIHRVTERGDNGELLGYGARNLFEPGAVRINIRDANDRLVTGFWTRPDWAERYGAAAVRDLEATTGQKFHWELGGPR